MNKSQACAQKWLKSNLGLKQDEIQFREETPTFVTTDGRGFHVKKLFNKTAVFYEGEMETLLQNFDRSSLLLVSDEGQVKQVPARVLLDDKEHYEEYIFKHVEPQAFNGISGDVIPIKFSKRNETSRYFRVNHVPLEPILMWPKGGYELRKSIDSTGKLTPWLILRPEVLQ